jgi:predicted house-cleaning noncanonical NTP pyrophosphatase (MazG superfamily)
MKYDKLIRDLVPSRMDSKGVKYSIHKANGEEYQAKLRNKLQEEVAEYLKDLNTEELTDILEVVFALGELHGASPAVLEELRAKKAAERGGFKNMIILDEGE